MRRLWLRIKEFLNCRRGGKREVSVWDDLPPDRRAKLEKELDQMMADFDRIERNNNLTQFILNRLEERERRVSKGSRPEGHLWN